MARDSLATTKAEPIAARPRMKKDTLINLYWILDAVQKAGAPDPRHVGECFVAIRDELMLPDTEEIVDHIRDVLVRQQAAADVLTDRVIGGSRRQPLPELRLIEMMATMAEEVPAAVAVAFGRRVEAEHGIRA
jgi:hypothetical protein